MTTPDPIVGVRDALLLLQTGRAAIALRLLETLPAAIEKHLAWVRLCARAEAEAASLARLRDTQRVTRALPAHRTPSPHGRAQRLLWLQDALAEAPNRAKARETLRLTDVLLDRVVAGALDLSGQQWRRLREALA